MKGTPSFKMKTAISRRLASAENATNIKLYFATFSPLIRIFEWKSRIQNPAMGIAGI
jgi:hypothetical protein